MPALLVGERQCLEEWAAVDAEVKRAGAVVDPADPDVVMEAVQRLGVNLTHVLAILLTRAFPGPPYCTHVRTGFLLTDS